MKDSVAIVGPGNVGRSLAVALHATGIRITEIVTRDNPSSRKKSMTLARQVKARSATTANAKLDANIIWICVSDSAIAAVAAQLAKLPVKWKGKTVLHASGPLTTAELRPLKRLGASTASFHPMNSFVPGWSQATTRQRLRGTPFGVEGDLFAIKTATRLADALAHPATGRVFRIRAADKVMYHAVGAFASPLMISALNVAERIARTIGIKDARSLMIPILISSQVNFMQGGSAGAFSGPIRRGDVDTVRKHLTALKRVPNAESVYRALALNAVEHLPGKNQAELRALLKPRKK